jgi:hypothetical protein
MSGPIPTPVASPESEDISPKTPAPEKSGNGGYFPPAAPPVSAEHPDAPCPAMEDKGKGRETDAVEASPTTPTSPGITFADGENGAHGRKASVSSISFRRPRNPSLPQGSSKMTDGKRIRAGSPPPMRYAQ